VYYIISAIGDEGWDVEASTASNVINKTGNQHRKNI